MIADTPYIGIDLGSHNIRICTCEQIDTRFNTTVFECPLSDQRAIPNVMSFPTADGSFAVGQPALLASSARACNNIISYLPLLSHKLEAPKYLTENKSFCSARMEEYEGDVMFLESFRENPKMMNALEALVLVLKKVSAEIRNRFNMEEKQIIQAVFTVGGHLNVYGPDACQMIREAAKASNIEVLYLLDSTTAGALSYQKSNTQPKSNILVFDMGSSHYSLGIFQVLKEIQTEYIVSEMVGGTDIDKILYNYCIQVLEQEGTDISTNSRKKHFLRKECEKAKKVFSSDFDFTATAEIKIDQENDLTISISAEQFGAMMSEIVKRIEQDLETCFQNTINPESIQDIVLMGAVTRLPQIQQIFKIRFPELPLHQRVIAEDASAQGASLYRFLKAVKRDNFSIKNYNKGFTLQDSNRIIAQLPSHVPCSFFRVLNSEYVFLHSANQVVQACSISSNKLCKIIVKEDFTMEITSGSDVATGTYNVLSKRLGFVEDSIKSATAVWQQSQDFQTKMKKINQIESFVSRLQSALENATPHVKGSVEVLLDNFSLRDATAKYKKMTLEETQSDIEKFASELKTTVKYLIDKQNRCTRLMQEFPVPHKAIPVTIPEIHHSADIFPALHGCSKLQQEFTDYLTQVFDYLSTVITHSFFTQWDNGQYQDLLKDLVGKLAELKMEAEKYIEEQMLRELRNTFTNFMGIVAIRFLNVQIESPSFDKLISLAADGQKKILYREEMIRQQKENEERREREAKLQREREEQARPAKEKAEQELREKAKQAQLAKEKAESERQKQPGFFATVAFIFKGESSKKETETAYTNERVYRNIEQPSQNNFYPDIHGCRENPVTEYQKQFKTASHPNYYSVTEFDNSPYQYAYQPGTRLDYPVSTNSQQHSQDKLSPAQENYQQRIDLPEKTPEHKFYSNEIKPTEEANRREHSQAPKNQTGQPEKQQVSHAQQQQIKQTRKRYQALLKTQKTNGSWLKEDVEEILNQPIRSDLSLTTTAIATITALEEVRDWSHNVAAYNRAIDYLKSQEPSGYWKNFLPKSSALNTCNH